MSKGLKLEVSTYGLVNVLRLRGEIDETFKPGAFTDACGRYTVVDLDDVRRITSFGVREWLSALRQVPGNVYLCFINVRPSLAIQFNLVAGFGGRGDLVSLYAPFVCPSTGEELDLLVDLRVDLPAVLAGTLALPPCHGEEVPEFDDVPETYFQYVVSRAAPIVPAVVAAVLDRTALATRAQFVMEKEVFASVTALRFRGYLDRRVRLKRMFDGLEGLVLIILDWLEGADREALCELEPLVSSGEISVYFAHVSVELMALLRDVVPHARERVLSATVPVTDAGGEPLTVDVSRDRFAELAAGRMRSPLSGKLLQVPDEPLLGLLDAMLGAPAEAMIDYLERKTVPSSMRGTSSHSRLSTPVQSGTRGYDIDRLLGSGGMADVFVATQRGEEGFRKKVVLKTIRPSLEESPDHLEMFLQEARVAARLVHPNIAQILDLGRSGDRYFIALEYVEGADLRRLLSVAHAIGEQVPLEMICAIGNAICAGLTCAHGAVDEHQRPLRIVHRDVSPKNILLSKDGIIKITDFGVASVARSFVESAPGSMVGTLTYMAPEQARGEEAIDARADLFALGIVLYECIASGHPFRRASSAETLHAITSRPHVPLSVLRSDVPPALERAVDWALAKDPAERCPSARELGRQLEVAAEELEPVTPSRLGQWVRHVLDRASADTPGSIAGRRSECETVAAGREPVRPERPEGIDVRDMRPRGTAGDMSR